MPGAEASGCCPFLEEGGAANCVAEGLHRAQKPPLVPSKSHRAGLPSATLLSSAYQPTSIWGMGKLHLRFHRAAAEGQFLLPARPADVLLAHPLPEHPLPGEIRERACRRQRLPVSHAANRIAQTPPAPLWLNLTAALMCRRPSVSKRRAPIARLLHTVQNEACTR